MKILVVDDEELIRNVIKEYLTIEGYKVDEAEDGNIAINKAKTNNYDLIIMDIMMPNKDGFSAIKEIKEDKNVPCIMLSARGEEYDKLLGFDLGIDDYVTKPFSPKELVARIKAILKRVNNEEEKYKFGGLTVDDKAHVVLVNEKEINLTPKEYDLLKYFIKNKNIALSREQLLSAIWGYDFYGDDRTIDTHIKTLRKNLLEYGNLITTVRGMGYKFEYKEETK
ncbi:MAG: response regulator transcription factor [Bacilli bacterium]|nr:response regulator transcription factor [Bacilli bacterium]